MENSYFFFKCDSFYIQTPIDKDNDSYKLKDNKNSFLVNRFSHDC